MNTQKRLHKIAKRILSDLNFSTREQLDDYLKKYPNTRPDTKFFVDGIEVKVDSQSKKTEKNNNVVDAILKKHSFLKGGKGMVNIYKKILEKEGSLDNIPEKAKVAAFNFVNSQLGKGNELSRKNFDLLFESGLEAFKKEFLKDEKKEEERKREEEERKEEEKRETTKEKIITSTLSDKSREKVLRSGYEKIRKLAEHIYAERIHNKSTMELYGFDDSLENFENFKIKIDNFTLSDVVGQMDDFFNDKNLDKKQKINLEFIKLIDELNPDFKNLYEQTNEKLKKRGLPEVSIEEFRKRYNEAKLPLLAKGHPTKKQLERFCLKHITNKFVVNNTENFHLTATAINAMQNIKREFPNLFKLNIKEFGVDIHPKYNQENYAARTLGGRALDINSESFNDFFKKAYYCSIYSKDGNIYKQGRVFYGTIGSFSSPEELTTFAINHEMGHLTKALFYLRNGGFWQHPAYNNQGKMTLKIYDPKCQKIEQAIEDLYNESLKNGDIYKLTWYASTEPEEFWAEIFSMYYNDKDLLPPNILTKLEEIINALKS